MYLWKKSNARFKSLLKIKKKSDLWDLSKLALRAVLRADDIST